MYVPHNYIASYDFLAMHAQDAACVYLHDGWKEIFSHMTIAQLYKYMLLSHMSINNYS